jgi:hypothetical protein
MHRSTWTSVTGAVVGAVAGLFLGALLALVASAVLIFLSFGTDVPSGWAAVLVQPAIFWVVAGTAGGALIGRRIARRAATEMAEPPPRAV